MAYFFSSAELIACKDVGIFEAFSCPWPPSPTFYKLREIERVAQDQVKCTMGTAFMIAPNRLVTAGHLIHVEKDYSKPIHTHLKVIRAPGLGMPPESASLIAVDPLHDVALLQIASPRSAVTVVGLSQIVPHGSSCGAFGFPLASNGLWSYRLGVQPRGALPRRITGTKRAA